MTKNKILIIEDDPIISEMYAEKLKLEGFLPDIANGGIEALKLIKKGFDLILLDIIMPGYNGFEILKNIKNKPTLRKIPVIVLTNVGSETVDADRDLALSLGAAEYLVKSFHTPEDIVTRIKKYLT
jgi:DNA-binding response OmpR family regulator